MRSGILRETAIDGATPALNYETFKRTHLDTAAECARAGLFCVPMVLESHSSTWGPAALQVFRTVANMQRLVGGGISGSHAHYREMLQSFSVAAVREVARSILRRAPGSVVSQAPVL